MKGLLKGFTLIEVLIVVVILGILATLAVPRLVSQSEKAKTAEAINMLSSIRRAALSYHDEYSEYPVITAADAVVQMQNLLGLEFDQRTWTVTTSANGGAIMAAGPGGTVYLDTETGFWTGTGDYAPDGSKCAVLSPRAVGQECE